MDTEKRVELIGNLGTVTFLWKYVEMKRKPILERALVRASTNGLVLCSIIEIEGTVEANRKQIALHELEAMFYE